MPNGCCWRASNKKENQNKYFPLACECKQQKTTSHYYNEKRRGMIVPRFWKFPTLWNMKQNAVVVAAVQFSNGEIGGAEAAHTLTYLIVSHGKVGDLRKTIPTCAFEGCDCDRISGARLLQSCNYTAECLWQVNYQRRKEIKKLRLGKEVKLLT